MDALAVDPQAALAAGAAVSPESPLIFFRDPRGHFTWWSWASALAAVRGELEPGVEAAGALAARDFLARLVELDEAERRGAGLLLPATPAVEGRHVALATGDLSRPVERVLGVAALAGGWAIVHEPGSALHPDTFLWARPTIAGGTAGELLALLAAVSERAPRWRRRRWLERRLRRLRALVLDAGEPAAAVETRAKELGARVAVLSIHRGGW